MCKNGLVFSFVLDSGTRPSEKKKSPPDKGDYGRQRSGIEEESALTRVHLFEDSVRKQTPSCAALVAVGGGNRSGRDPPQWRGGAYESLSLFFGKRGEG